MSIADFEGAFRGTEVHGKIQVKFWSSDSNCYFSVTKHASEILRTIIPSTKISICKNNVLAMIGDQKLPVLQSGVVVSFEAHVISSQDYSPFGVTLSGRSWSEGYRYGFNRKEKDDNTFEGAYDFGARILDARLGRWMSMDAHHAGQPQWSTYKAFKDNPIIFNDPDGNTEYLKVIIQDQNGNSLVFTCTKSEDVMTDGVVRDVEIIFGLKEPAQYYYNFERVVSYTIDENGKLLQSTEQFNILKEQGIKDIDYPQMSGKEEKGFIKDPDGFNNLDFQESGFHLTNGSDGGSDPVKNKNNGGRSVDIADFLTAVSGFMKDPTNLPNLNSVLGPAELFSLGTEIQGEIDKLNINVNNQTIPTTPQLGDSVIFSTTKVTMHESTSNGRKSYSVSHGPGPDLKGVIPQDSAGQVFKGDKTLIIDSVKNLPKK